MQRNYRFRLYPTQAQEQQLEAMLVAYCDLYNAALFERIDCYRKTGQSLNYYDQANQLKAVRAVDDRLAATSYSGQQQLLRRVDKAFKAFFQRLKRGEKPGFPRFQAKARFDSIECRVGDGLTLKKGGKIGLTGMASTLKVKWHRAIPDNAKLGHAIISRNGGRWNVSFLVKLPETHACPREYHPVGVDVGISNLVALSEGTTLATPRWVREAEAKQRRLQRRIARRQMGSHRRKKAKRDYARFMRGVADARRDCLHQLSTQLVRTYSHIAVEDLDIRALGRGMLAKDVLNASWGYFLDMLRYKAECAGSVVEKVDPRFTSQLCSECGVMVPKLLSERMHHCPHCRYEADRDVNAARNILFRAQFYQQMRPGSGLRARSGPDVGVKLAREAVVLETTE